MCRLNFKFLNIFLIALLFLFPKTVSARFVGKVTAESVAAIEAALIKAGALKSGAAEALEKTFRASTAAHRLRLSEIFIQLRNNPEFAKKFPEYKDLLENPSKTIDALLLHDAGKADPDGNLAVKALSLLQGYDHRHRNPSLPADVDELVRKVLQDAIDDVNTLEKRYVSHGTAFDSQLSSFAEVLDYYDTFKSRQSEIAGAGRTLKSPSEWLDFLNNAKDKTKDFFSQKRLAHFIEDLDPLKNRNAFTQTADVLKHIGSNVSGDVARYFVQSGQQLKKLRHASNLKTFISMAGKGARKAPLLAAALTSGEYLIDPSDFSLKKSAEEIVMALTTTSQTSACATTGCAEFFRQCGKKIGAHNPNSYIEVSRHQNFENCLSDFLTLPLDVQTRLRRDIDLDNFFLAYFPRVNSIQCSGMGAQMKIQLELLTQEKENESQSLQFNDDGTLSLATRLPEKMDQLQFEGKLVSGLRHCQSGQSCQQYDIQRIKKEKPYFWKDENSILPKAMISKIPVKAFLWAKSNSTFLESQGQNIKNCCDSQSCRKNLKPIETSILSSRQLQPSLSSPQSKPIQAQR